MIKPFFTFLLSLLLLLVSYVTYAAKDFTDIDINYTYVEYLNFIGSAAGASRFFDHDDVVPLSKKAPGQPVNLGKLGLSSNISGDCTLDFSTLNDFSLMHLGSGQKLTNYRLDYRGTEISSGSNLQMTLPCNSTATDIDLVTTGNYKKKPKAGLYQDIVNIVVTTQ